VSVSGQVTFEGSALGERASRNVAEEIAKAVEGVLAKHGGTINWSTESKQETRPFLGEQPFGQWPERHVTVGFSYHVNDEPEADGQPAARRPVSVRAKMTCSKKEPFGDGFEIELYPVYSADPDSENGRFFNATPGGQVRLSIVNPSAADAFEVGKEYYVDFTPAS
jgi:hypothetical protein